MPLDTHVRVAAWLHIVMGALVVALLLVFGLIFGAFGAFGVSQGLDPRIAGWLAGFGIVLIGFFVALGAAEIVGGVLLLRGSGVGRVITIVFSAMSLLNFPIGTVIGAYSLWALLRELPQPQPVPAPMPMQPDVARPY